MNKPRYMERLLGIVYLWLGISFIGAGFLCFIGVLKPDTDSMIQEPVILGIVFSLLGAAFFIVQAILKAIASLKSKQYDELLASGTKVNGTIEKVYLQKYTQYGRQSPYRIFYTYNFQGKVYHHKSHLLWDKPDYREHDSIEVYASNSGKSAIYLI